MLTFYDSNGKSYTLTERLGSGGEGTVYVCPDDANLVAKIYHEPISDEKAEKLRLMAKNKNEQLLKVAAWIVDTLHDAPDGKTVGFLMPNVRAKEIHELYSLKSRRVHFPEATWPFLIHTAANVARAFYNLHRHNHVMGDVNHGNCVVLADGTVKLIDCDSYSIGIDDRRYPCEVGVATHLAPELHGQDLSRAERIPAHDNFGLAVIVFQLLFLGRHPFAGNYTGDEDKSLEDCIRELRFAYGGDAHLRQVKRPPGTLALASVSPRLALMFEQAFLTENRPEPREWIEALEDLSQNLKLCSVHPGHQYFSALAACPWCEIESQTGLMLFPFISGARSSSDEESFNIFTVENLLASFGTAPSSFPLIPTKPAETVAPSSEVNHELINGRFRLLFLAVIQFFVSVIMMGVFGLGFAVYISVIVLFVFLAIHHQSRKMLTDGLTVELDCAQKNLEKLQFESTKNVTSAQFDKNLALIKRKIADYQSIQEENRAQMKDLRDAAYRYRLDIYLSDSRLSDAENSGLESAQLDELKDFGIRSAADIEAGRLRSNSAIDYLTGAKLLDWRKNLEKNFSFKSDDAEIPAAEQKRLKLEFAEKRRPIEREIELLLGTLRAGSMHFRQRQQQMTAEFEKAARRLWQAEADKSRVGGSLPAFAVLFAVTFFALYGANYVQNSVNPPKPRQTASQSEKYSPPISDSEPNYSSAPDSSSKLDEEIYENITDNEIGLMTDAERIAAAKTILRQTDNLSSRIDYEKSEKKLRTAVRIFYDVEVINRLGYVLYKQDKCVESIKYYKKSLLLEPKNYEAQSFIGINYLQMQKFTEARGVFEDLTRRPNVTFDSYYNLGLAHEGLKEFRTAVWAFRKAAALKEADADTNYELGFCLNKIGDKEGARRQYEILLAQNQTELAEKLRTEIKIEPPVESIKSKR